jgi:hypothetical protein
VQPCKGSTLRRLPLLNREPNETVGPALAVEIAAGRNGIFELCLRNWRDLFTEEQPARRYAQVLLGYWVAKYSDKNSIKRILKKGCRAARLQFDVDLTVHYG